MSFGNLKTTAALWVMCGLLVGAGGTAAILNGNAGIRKAHADPIIKTKAASMVTSPSALGELQALDATMADLVEQVSPAVVSIRVGTNADRDRFGRPNAMGAGGEGSGVIYSADGWIITNAHVVNGFDKVTVALHDGREFKGRVIKSNDVQNDIAVVKIEAKDLPTLSLGDSNVVRPGQFAIAIGAPFGLESTVTVGHISALNRQPQSMIQTDASINPGNSGGPLINVNGEVVGINTSIIAQGSNIIGGEQGNVGIGFAIPSNQAKLIADSLIKDGKLVRGYMGIAPLDLRPADATDFGTSKGALVGEVTAGGPAEAAGLKVNDVITKVGDQPILRQQDIRNAMLRYRPGTKVDVEYLRNKVNKTASVTVAEFPKELVASNAAPEQGANPDFKIDPFGENDGKNFDDLQKEMEKRLKEFRDNNPGSSPKTQQQGKAKLGIGFQELNSSSRSQFKVPESTSGVVVTSVEPGSVAERIGIEVGDVVTQLDNTKISSVNDIKKIMDAKNWGDRLQVAYSRFKDGGQSTYMNSFELR